MIRVKLALVVFRGLRCGGGGGDLVKYIGWGETFCTPTQEHGGGHDFPIFVERFYEGPS